MYYFYICFLNKSIETQKVKKLVHSLLITPWATLESRQALRCTLLTLCIPHASFVLSRQGQMHAICFLNINHSVLGKIKSQNELSLKASLYTENIYPRRQWINITEYVSHLFSSRFDGARDTKVVNPFRSQSCSLWLAGQHTFETCDICVLLIIMPHMLFSSFGYLCSVTSWKPVGVFWCQPLLLQDMWPNRGNSE